MFFIKPKPTVSTVGDYIEKQTLEIHNTLPKAETLGYCNKEAKS